MYGMEYILLIFRGLKPSFLPPQTTFLGERGENEAEHLPIYGTCCMRRHTLVGTAKLSSHLGCFSFFLTRESAREKKEAFA